jgi:hypothetical protein
VIYWLVLIVHNNGFRPPLMQLIYWWTFFNAKSKRVGVQKGWWLSWSEIWPSPILRIWYLSFRLYWMERQLSWWDFSDHVLITPLFIIKVMLKSILYSNCLLCWMCWLLFYTCPTQWTLTKAQNSLKILIFAKQTYQLPKKKEVRTTMILYLEHSQKLH